VVWFCFYCQCYIFHHRLFVAQCLEDVTLNSIFFLWAAEKYSSEDSFCVCDFFWQVSLCMRRVQKKTKLFK
jgi:hypothetical protein